MRPAFVGLAALASLAGPSLHAQSLPPKAAVARVVGSLATAFLAAKESPSVSIAVVRGGDTIVFSAWGKENLENDVTTTPRSVYRIGSVTKQFTSSAVMQLVEQGKIKLDDSIGVYLPVLPAAWNPVQVRQLSTHTSGIPSYTDIGEAWVRRWGDPMTPDTLVALTAGKPMDFAPGTSWHYDNTGYVLLGMLIEKVTGHSWATDLTERFFTPLGLHDTRYCMTDPIIPHRAAYVGTYALSLPGGAKDFTVFDRAGTLYGQLEQQGPFPLHYLDHDTWGASFDPSLRLVFEREDGKVTKMTLQQGGGAFGGVRKP